MDWKNRVAIVTGASSGIGAAVAKDFVARGARVALVARTADKLETLAKSLGADRAVAFPLDVRDRKALTDLPRRVKERSGRLDFVVNNAGMNYRGLLRERSSRELEDILEANLLAPVLLTRAALDVIEPDGVVVNVASLAGKVPLPHEATYAASKAGLRSFSASLNTELSLHGSRVRVASVNPGPVDTGFFGTDLRSVPDIVFSQPLSSAEDVARAVATVIEEDLPELDVPVLSGKIATAAYLVPAMFTTLRPLFEKIGARKKAAFAKSRGYSA
ncbi:MAG TPA: SDR family NAD(P)-dependent oxidoreductase [Polyangiaceae bacterium]|nr:SDR family NAD(P)-dependent oxidoreductase [Polyangiaceae bacterium]